jgi:hypothetical protein
MTVIVGLAWIHPVKRERIVDANLADVSKIGQIVANLTSFGH